MSHHQMTQKNSAPTLSPGTLFTPAAFTLPTKQNSPHVGREEKDLQTVVKANKVALQTKKLFITLTSQLPIKSNLTLLLGPCS
jgi:hypothetical protein